MGEDRGGLMLKIEPVVNKKALDAAVDQTESRSSSFGS